MGKMGRMGKEKEPDAFRSRVFKRGDMEKRLENVFMKYEEVLNCTFEPDVGNMNRVNKKE